MKKRCLFVGIDGGDWQILDPLMAKGIMPNLARLSSKGQKSILRSTIPPYSGPAWSSVLTGVNPGKHGVFFWQEPWRLGRERKFLDNRDIRSPTLDQLLTKEGVRVGMMNFPFSYPVNKVAGFMVSGMLSPSLSSKSCYPSSLRANLKEVNYQFDLDLQSNERLSFLQDYIRVATKSVQKKTKIFLTLSRRKKPDFLGLVYTETDRIQHPCFQLVQRGLAGKLTTEQEKKTYNLAIKLYHEVDRGVGKLLSLVGDDDLVIIASDHGFTGTEFEVNLNRFLLNSRLMTPSRIALWSSYLVRIANFLGVGKERKAWAKKIMGLTVATSRDQGGAPLIHQGRVDHEKCLILDKTRVFMGQTAEAGFYFNPVLTKADQGKVERNLIKELGKLRCNNSKKVFSQIKKRSDYYWGEYLNLAPPIMYQVADHFSAVWLFDLARNLFSRPQNPYAGNHRQEGIMIMAGAGIDKKRLENSVWDIFPTILTYFGFQAPTRLDGKSLLIGSGDLKKIEKDYNLILKERRKEKTDYPNKKEEEKIKKRLERLGYI
jgi:predicted AlkP superfamily phosphohydrolase/phosphomutase